MLIIALDTCDRRGSVALARDESTLQIVTHEGDEDYSAWLLPAAHQVLGAAGVGMQDVEGFVAASGPGSFTGLRIGLTTVKAWSEVYGRLVAPVSRLMALATQAGDKGPFVASFADARRGQIFGGLFRQGEKGDWETVGEEMVIGADAFLEWVRQQTGDAGVQWVGLDREIVEQAAGWEARSRRGERIQSGDAVVAPWLAKLGLGRLKKGLGADALTVDANYVRRSDAEIFWKAGGRGGR